MASKTEHQKQGYDYKSKAREPKGTKTLHPEKGRALGRKLAKKLPKSVN